MSTRIIPKPSLVLFGFIPVDLYVLTVGDSSVMQKRMALLHISELLRRFLKCIPEESDLPSTQRNPISLEITAHISSLLTVLQKLLDLDYPPLSKECFSILSASFNVNSLKKSIHLYLKNLIMIYLILTKILVKDLPTHILSNVQDFMLAALYHRLDINDDDARRAIQIISSKICKRLPTQCIFSFLLLQLGCRNSAIRRNSIDVLATIIITTEIDPFEVKSISEKLISLLFDPEQSVIRKTHYLFCYR